jgi:hypothetical protein
MSVNLSPVAGAAAQFLDNSGNVLTGGKLYTYAAGTTTPQATYTSGAGVTFHSNPIILDAAGRVPAGGEIWLTDGVQYKFVLKDSNDVLIGTWDNLIGINSNFLNYYTQEEIQTATAGQTVFTLATVSYQPGTNSLSVFVDGVNQYDGVSYAYIETNSTTVTFTSGLHVGALVKFTTAVTLSSGVTDSSLVTYDPPFTGSVPTTVELKLAQTISVMDFGATGNGVTDDTLAIQNAIDYCVANQKGCVFVPSGTYNITAPLKLYTGISFIGENSRTAIISKSTNTNGTGSNLARGGTKTDSFVYDDIIQVRHADNAYAYGVTIKGLRLTKTGYAANSHGIYYPRAAYFTVEDVHILNVQYGTFTYDTFVSSIKNTQVQAVVYGFTHANDGSGSGSGTTALFQNCAVNFDNTIVQPAIGFNLVNLTYSNLLSCGVDNGNTATGAGITAYYLQSSNTINVSGCGCENSQGRMIYIGSGSATFTGLRTIAITGSTSALGTVVAETSSTLTLVNCKFEPLLVANAQYNWTIQTGASVVEVNPQASPSGGNTFISYSGGASKNTLSPTSPFSAASFRTLFESGQTFTVGVPFTIFTITSGGTWIVNAYVPNSGANYQSCSLVVSDGVTATITSLKAGGNLPITLSGLDVVVTSTVGSTTGGVVSTLKIG